ncbi:copper homeostasis protein CutC [Paramaledivibacter caminithermalis]|uniref:PF03932 family protein CutC n=1 Tax=Paramaledivibacter caminithermalis (strain DSM 15212 / CIP 107654 / DViRD3) TaxID=1121301 RepID=A0A1M6NQE6_PARC5|nr:copper homeostasis protein CutC [Paramaledivibacter caminithermalis]SHJ97925.1 copper homeostasis protein [Paramaledivibacter caminithermalis DSM 15212]
MILEVCVDSYTSMVTAKSAGADRIELCSALNIGGLTPSYGLMKKAKEIEDIEVFVMIRPRCGDFLYDDNEFETMKQDINIVKQMGFDGIVTGILLRDGRIDIDRMKELVKIASPLKVVFHRAFDDAKNPMEDIPRLIEIGVCRILTSGQRANALEGANYIAKVQKKFGDSITIMPGCGVNADNIEQIYEITKCTHYHLSGKVNVGSQMEYRECIKRMGTPETEFVVERADYNLIKKVRDIIDNIEDYKKL